MSQTFQPSKYSHYGSTDPSAEEGTALPSEDVLRAVSTFLFGDTAREEEQVIVAQIQNHQAQAKNAIGPIRTYHLNQINKLQAKLNAVREKAGEDRYAAQTSAVTRTGVALISVLGVAAVGFGTLYIGAKAWRAIKEA